MESESTVLLVKALGVTIHRNLMALVINRGLTKEILGIRCKFTFCFVKKKERKNLSAPGRDPLCRRCPVRESPPGVVRVFHLFTHQLGVPDGAPSLIWNDLDDEDFLF